MGRKYRITFRDLDDGLFIEREIEAESRFEALRLAEEYRKTQFISPDSTEIWAVDGERA